MGQMLRRALFGVGFGAILYAAAVLVVDAGRLGGALAGYAWSGVGIALFLSCGNYALRFLKWELCLSWLDIRGSGEGDAPHLTRARSALIYAAGLSMSVTPGKVGEVLRSWLLRSSHGVSGSRTAPIVVADRLTDLIALVVLSLVGISRSREYLPVVAVSALLVVGGLAFLTSPPLLRALLRAVGRLGFEALTSRLERALDSSAVLLRVRPLLWLTAISVVGWGMECLGYYFVLRGFAGVTADPATCAFLWATTTLIGAVSLLPGGLGATEGSLAVLAARLVPGVTGPVAVASTLLIRTATLWFAVAMGGAALALFLRDPSIHLDPDVDAAPRWTP